MEQGSSSLMVARAALRMALTETRQEEHEERQRQNGMQIAAVAVDFGGEFISSVKKVVERAVVAAQRQNVVAMSHTGEGAVAGATREALEQIMPKAIGLNVGGKIGIARYREHLCVAIFCSVGVLNLNEVAVGLAHRSLPLS